MYDSAITAADFISGIREELDIAAVIPDSAFVRWLNVVEQTVYTELIRELRAVKIEAEYGEGNTVPIAISSIETEDGEEDVIFDDIVKVYADGVELDRVSLISGLVFDNLGMYWHNKGYIEVKMLIPPRDFTIVHVVRPKRKTENDTDTVKLPAEWLEIAASRLRGEAYKLANDDNMAAKWLNDYNLYLEQFKVWLDKNKVYGEK